MVFQLDAQMNFGAALRCAHFLGAAGVLACSRNAAPLSPVVSKASAGALEVRCALAAAACGPCEPHVAP